MKQRAYTMAKPHRHPDIPIKLYEVEVQQWTVLADEFSTDTINYTTLHTYYYMTIWHLTIHNNTMVDSINITKPVWYQC